MSGLQSACVVVQALLALRGRWSMAKVCAMMKSVVGEVMCRLMSVAAWTLERLHAGQCLVGAASGHVTSVGACWWQALSVCIS